MGQVLELRQKISTDWTAVERLQLDALVSCLPARLADEIEFGVSDSGDPWCAVLNQDGEVVLHVARIAGRFYVHSTIEPFVAEARDLPTAVAPFVGDSFVQQRHVASITPMYGLVMPLHAYAMPSEMPVEPRAEMIGDASDAPPSEAETATSELPQAPEPWSAPVFTLGAAVADRPLEPQPDLAEQVLFPIQDSDWASPMSSQLLDFSAPQKIESVTSLEIGDVTFQPYVLAAPETPAIAIETVAPPDADAATPDTRGGTAGDNVINVNFGQSFTGADSASAPHTGFAAGALDGLDRAAAGVELVISDVDPGVIVAWSDAPASLAGVTPLAEVF